MTDELFLLEGRMSKKKYLLYCEIFFGILIFINYFGRFIENFVAEAGYDFAAILLFSGGFSIKILIVLLIMVITVKRLHDINVNGVFTLLAAIPYIQIAVVFILCIIKGNEGANKYGENPMEGQSLDKKKTVLS